MFRVALILLLLGAVGDSARAALKPQDVLAHGATEHANDYFWIGQVGPATPPRMGDQTVIYFRERQGEWRALGKGPVPARVISMTSRESVLGLLLDDGQYMLLFSDGTAFTPGLLPNDSPIVALAGSRDAWWAVGRVTGGLAAVTTQPATRAATQPATAAAITTRPADRLVLFSQHENSWSAVAELPGDLNLGTALSLAVFEDTAYLAALTGPRQLRLLTWHGSKWTDHSPLASDADIVSFRLLSSDDAPWLWIAQTAGPDLLYVNPTGGQTRFQLSPPAGSTPSARAVTRATGNIHQVALVDGKLVDQLYDGSKVTPQGQATPLELPNAAPTLELQYLQYAVVMGALAFAIVASLRQRVMMRGMVIDPAALALAPLGRRLAAGVIDAAPVLIAVAVAERGGQGGPSASRQLLLLIVYTAAAAFYVLYTTIIEPLAGRSVGKMLLGLRVARLDGGTPTSGALATRNVLRLIDVGLFFVPLVVILFSPLRQRAGDVAAGTLVVLARGPRPQEETAEPVQQNQDAGAAQ